MTEFRIFAEHMLSWSAGKKRRELAKFVFNIGPLFWCCHQGTAADILCFAFFMAGNLAKRAAYSAYTFAYQRYRSIPDDGSWKQFDTQIAVTGHSLTALGATFFLHQMTQSLADARPGAPFLGFEPMNARSTTEMALLTGFAAAAWTTNMWKATALLGRMGGIQNALSYRSDRSRLHYD